MGCQCGGVYSGTVGLTGVQGWSAQSRGRAGRCGARRGRVTAGGAHEAALVGCRIVVWLVTWRPSRSPVAQWGCKTWWTCRRCAPWQRSGHASQWRRRLAQASPVGKSPGKQSKISKGKKKKEKDKRKKKKEKILIVCNSVRTRERRRLQEGRKRDERGGDERREEERKREDGKREDDARQ